MSYTPTKAQAEQAIAEYNAAYEAGGELPYPMDAEIALKAIEQAEQLTERVVEMGGRK